MIDYFKLSDNINKMLFLLYISCILFIMLSSIR